MKKEGEVFNADAVQFSANVWREHLLGKVVRHWKGGEYVVTSVDVDEASGMIRVSYRSVEKAFEWSRTIDNFTGLVSPELRRFEVVV